MTLAGAPLTTLSAMSNGAIHFSGKDLFFDFCVTNARTDV